MRRKMIIAMVLAISLNLGLGQIQNEYIAGMGFTSRAEAFNLLSLFVPSERDMRKSYQEMISYYMAGFELSSRAAALSNELLNDYGVKAELVNVNAINASSAGYDSTVDMVMKKGNSGVTVKMPEIDADRFFAMVPASDSRLADAKKMVMLKDECFSRGREIATMLALQTLVADNRGQKLGMLVGSAMLLNEWKSNMDSSTGVSYQHFEKSLKAMNKVDVDENKIKKAADRLRKA